MPERRKQDVVKIPDVNETINNLWVTNDTNCCFSDDNNFLAFNPNKFLCTS